MEILSNIGSRQTQPDVAVEALNFIFDVYSDCAFDYDAPVYVQGKFNNQLKQILPAFKSMVSIFCNLSHCSSRSMELNMNCI
jgi:hypothetical protein